MLWRVETLVDIPCRLDADALMRKARVLPGTDDAEVFAQLLAEAQRVARPKAAFKEAYVEARSDQTVTIDGVTFTSRALRINLDGAERVFPYVATCGTELDGVRTDPGEFLAPYWLDTIKEAVLPLATDHLHEYLHRTYALPKTSAMSPGSGDATVWPIEQQRELFDLLGDVHGAIGVRLTESFLMVPAKTVSGIHFPTEIDFQSCQLCRRERCQFRQAPFDAKAWQAMHLAPAPDEAG